MSSYQTVLDFATKAHGTQLRKYTNELYIFHPIDVASILSASGAPEHVIAAGLLHDVLEDTPVTAEELNKEFGEAITLLVLEVTDIAYAPHDGNRAARSLINANHLARASYWGQTIKFADFIDNTRSIKKYGKGFWQVYRKEKLYALSIMDTGDRALWQRALSLCD